MSAVPSTPALQSIHYCPVIFTSQLASGLRHFSFSPPLAILMGVAVPRLLNPLATPHVMPPPRTPLRTLCWFPVALRSLPKSVAWPSRHVWLGTSAPLPCRPPSSPSCCLGSSHKALWPLSPPHGLASSVFLKHAVLSAGSILSQLVYPPRPDLAPLLFSLIEPWALPSEHFLRL